MRFRTPRLSAPVGSLALGGGREIWSALRNSARRPFELSGDLDGDSRAIAAALDDASPDLVLDYLWGMPAEAALRALDSMPGHEPISYVEIGDIAGGEARVPGSLLRGRPFRLSGSGIGSFDMRRYLREAQAYLKIIGDGTVTVEAAAYPLQECAEAWTAGPGPRPVLVSESS